MTIRIDSIESELTDDGYRWRLDAKGLFGQGIYFTVETGLNGQGLYAVVDGGKLKDMPTTGFVVTATDHSRGFNTKVELVPPSRFEIHDQCNARDVVHRVATALVMIGWGPEFHDDRDSISGDRTVHVRVIDFQKKPVAAD